MANRRRLFPTGLTVVITVAVGFLGGGCGTEPTGDGASSLLPTEAEVAACLPLICDDLDPCTIDTCASQGDTIVCGHEAACGGGLVCDPATGACVECVDGQACDDHLFCNGIETCEANTCGPGADPCLGQICQEGEQSCVGCRENADCDDSSFCTGVETCVGGECRPGTTPCSTDEVCDEDHALCLPAFRP